jgi:glutathione S-transferase
MRYELYYWPSNQGRGEFVRLALEEAAADYLDVGRLPETEGGGVPAILKLMNDAAVRATVPQGW